VSRANVAVYRVSEIVSEATVKPFNTESCVGRKEFVSGPDERWLKDWCRRNDRFRGRGVI
jgi:hypothetical protein